VSILPHEGIIVHIDADLSVSPRYIPLFVKKILAGKHDIVICSRLKSGAKVKRRVYRTFLTVGYNAIINMLFKDGIRDHQCGFKAFNLEKTRDIILNTIDSGWFWDTEVLVRAKRAGLNIYEMPVEWIESFRDSKVNIWKDATKMLLSALKLRIRLWKE